LAAECTVIKPTHDFVGFNWDAEGTLRWKFLNNNQTMQNKNISHQSGYLFIYLFIFAHDTQQGEISWEFFF
jgi:hypothetical protein